MRVLLIHNYYQHAGGEGRVFAAEAALLQAHGHTVSRYTMHNDQVSEYRPWDLVRATLWNPETYRRLSALIRRERPEIAHIYNTFPLISPAAHYACQAAGLPVVQTMQNYRLLCPNALFLRGGRVCEECLGKALPWPGIHYACYRNSRPQTAVVVAMLAYHRWRRTWQEQVDVYLAVSNFSRQKLVSGGLPDQKFVLKPNFVDLGPGPNPGSRNDGGRGEYALYVGRLSAEKGIHSLLTAWQAIPHVPLKIVGDGPLEDEAAKVVREQNLTQVELLGRRVHADVLELIKQARFVVLPSECYENLPMVILEAFACGVPLVASRRGAMEETVIDGQTGLHFAPGDSADLAAKAQWAWAHPRRMADMGKMARHEFEAKYTAEGNYRQLIAVYRAAINRKAQ